MGMRPICDGIFVWDWFSERHGYDFHGYLVEPSDGEGALVIDPVEPDEATLAALVAAKPARILLTNRNHYRAAALVKAKTGARVSAHPADTHFIVERGVAVDDALVAGQHIGRFEIVAAPGKSPGEVALYWAERRLLIVGDACVGAPPGRLRLLPDAVIDDKSALLLSLRALAALDIDTLLVADGESILHDAGQALRELVR